MTFVTLFRITGKKVKETGFHTKSLSKVKIGNYHNIAALAEETKLPGEKKIAAENLIPVQHIIFDGDMTQRGFSGLIQ
ncbi:MAG: hypothetical protein WA004_05380 [Saprospiraceae bacterium]